MFNDDDEDSRFEFSKEEIDLLVRRFDGMVKENKVLFFDVEEFMEISSYYMEKGNPRMARKSLEMGLQQHTQSTDLLLQKASVCSASGRLKEGHEALDIVELLEPLNDQVYLLRGQIYGQQRWSKEAIENYEKALKLSDEASDEIYMDIAFEYENLGNFDKAIDALKMALKLNAENEAVLYELGFCYAAIEKEEEWAEFLQDYINEHPYSETAWYNLGNAFYNLDLVEKAIESYDYCITINERFTSAYFNLGNAYLSLEQFDSAIEAYSHCLKLEDSSSSLTHCYIGECYERKAEYESAIVHYKMALDIDPDYSEAWLGMGIVKDAQGKIHEAVLFIEKAVELAPDNSEYLEVLAEGYEKLGRIEDAKTIFKKCLIMAPYSTEARISYAQMVFEYEMDGDYLDILNEGLLLQPDNASLHFSLSGFLMADGRFVEAESHLIKGLEIDKTEVEKLWEVFPEALHLQWVRDVLIQYLEKDEF
jgi:tetratricopeptide (TPR) repeat protein